MKKILVVSVVLLTLLGIIGCNKCNHLVSSKKSMECQRLQRFLGNIEQLPGSTGKTKMVAFFGEDSNEPIDNIPFEEFKQVMFQVVGCCLCRPHLVANEYTVCNRLECIRQYLKTENVQKIAFYNEFVDMDNLNMEKTEPPESWGNPWAKITEPKNIKEVLNLLYNAVDTERDRFANELSPMMPMLLVTDKHKFIIEVIDYDNAICGIGWTSHELKEKLAQWGFRKRD